MAAIFGKKKAATKVDGAPSAIQALRDAFERNCPAGFARLGHVGEDPLASGRLLSWDDNSIEVEELQVIGGEIRFGVGDKLECYATLGDDVIAFGAKVVELARPQRLNESTVVHSIKLEGPTNVEFGNRRGGYRAQLSALGGDYEGEIWFLDRRAGDSEPDESGEEDTNSLFTSIRAAARMPDELVAHEPDLRLQRLELLAELVELELPTTPARRACVSRHVAPTIFSAPTTTSAARARAPRIPERMGARASRTERSSPA